jgi:hypothetical protein
VSLFGGTLCEVERRINYIGIYRIAAQRSFSFFILFFISFTQLRAQRENLQSFDDRYLHFGFLLSVNTSSFFLDFNPDFNYKDSLLSIDNVPQAGFNLALMSSLNPIKNLNIRFVPGLSFQDRGLSYTYRQPNDEIKTYLKRTESVWLQFPLLLKFRTNRAGNFAAYALFGGSLDVDMQSQKDVDENVAGKIVVKLEKTNYTVDAGGGMDFFLPYFKLGIEMKTCFGMKNLLIQENNQFTTPISKLRTRAFVFSVSFEG